jgi:ergothioneine biosynthesis protein EgtB
MENMENKLNLSAIDSSLTGKDSNEFFRMFKKVRGQTIELVEPLEIEDFVVQTEAFMSPPRWHIGHVSWFYEQLLRKYYKNFKPHREDYSFYLNSYYQQFGQPFVKAKRGTISRPTVQETIEYWRWINMQVSNFFEETELNDELKRLFLLGYNHEWQHQELMVYDLQHLLQDRYMPKEMKQPPASNGSTRKKEMVKIKGGIFEMGFDPKKYPNEFAYDIEMPLHKVYLNDYYIDNTPVTNGDFIEFINDGGYKNYKWWLSDGWETVKKNKWQAPMYWEQDEKGNWIKHDFKGKRYIDNFSDEPVINLSSYEAYAYAKWAGKRLPTEAEWEKAASWDEDKGTKRLYPWGDEHPDDKNSNLLESKIFAPTDVFTYEKGKSYYGCYAMVGDNWEWTNSEFNSYPGFKTGFAEYNDKWFGNQKVLRGGSFGTPRLNTRNTYRNFFRPDERWMISGFRCAKDA